MYLHGRAFTHGTMDRPIELFLISANDPQSGVTKAVVWIILSV